MDPRRLRPVLFLSAVLLSACSASVKDDGGFGDGGGSSVARTTSGSGGAPSASSGVTSVGASVASVGASTGSGSTGSAEVFAHSDVTLYRLDPNTKVVTTVGDFDGCSSVVDIALDKAGDMVGTTEDGIYTIDKTTAKCSLLKSGDYPNSLSFVPAGTLDPNVEALVGFLGADYVRIDQVTGQVTTVGSLGPNAGDLESSGDVVSVIGGGTYLTVDGSDCEDCILEIDPKTGAMIKNLGQLSFGGVYGLAYWAGTAYGFDEGGDLFAIDLPTAQCSLLPPVGASQFWGAGSTTSAPVGPE